MLKNCLYCNNEFDTKNENKKFCSRVCVNIKSINTIIEVKSEYTFNLHKDINLAKQNACIDLGFYFNFNIIDKNGVQGGKRRFD